MELNPLAGGTGGRSQSEVSIYQFHATIRLYHPLPLAGIYVTISDSLELLGGGVYTMS
jgi:hypothetical protein